MKSNHPLARRIQYNQWANREALGSLVGATTPPQRGNEILGHIIGAETNWLTRVAVVPAQGEGLPIWPTFDHAEAGRRLAGLVEKWNVMRNENPAESLDRMVAYVNQRNESYSTRLADILDHLLLHSAYHRGQIATLLGRQGHAAASTDFIQWVRLGEPAVEASSSPWVGR
jgi:uncharacterized damage-inducible protein DinB